MNEDLAKARIDRKRLAASFRRDIRLATKQVGQLAQDLKKPKADVWTIARQLSTQAIVLASSQKRLNAVLNNGDELQILKRATKKVLTPPVMNVEFCGKCRHPSHDSFCNFLVTWNAGFGVVHETCGCTSK